MRNVTNSVLKHFSKTLDDLVEAVSGMKDSKKKLRWQEIYKYLQKTRKLYVKLREYENEYEVTLNTVEEIQIALDAVRNEKKESSGPLALEEEEKKKQEKEKAKKKGEERRRLKEQQIEKLEKEEKKKDERDIFKGFDFKGLENILGQLEKEERKEKMTARLKAHRAQQEKKTKEKQQNEPPEATSKKGTIRKIGTTISNKFKELFS